MESKTKKLFLIFSGISDRYNKLTKFLSDDGWLVRSINNLQVLVAVTEQFEDGKVCLLISEPLDRNLTKREISLIVKFVSKDRALLLAGNGDTNLRDGCSRLNNLASRFGIEFNADCVIRPNLYKQNHPKEALLEDLVVNRGFGDVLKERVGRKESANEESFLGRGLRSGPRIIYAQGCTLNPLSKVPSIIMTSSRWALPSNQAICSICRDSDGGGRVVCIGSATIMDDRYIEMEDNRALLATLIELASNANFPVNVSDAKTVEIPESNITPDVNRLLEVPISCFQELEPLPEDKSKLIDGKLFNIDNSMIPKLIEAYGKLNISRGPLTLIKPELDRVPLELEPATHGFLLRKV